MLVNALWRCGGGAGGNWTRVLSLCGAAYRCPVWNRCEFGGVARHRQTPL